MTRCGAKCPAVGCPGKCVNWAGHRMSVKRHDHVAVDGTRHEWYGQPITEREQLTILLGAKRAKEVLADAA